MIPIPPSRRQLIGVPLRRRPLRDIPAAGRDAELTLGQWTRPGCHAAVAGVTRGAEAVCRCRTDTADRSVPVVRGTELKEPLPSTARRGTDNIASSELPGRRRWPLLDCRTVGILDIYVTETDVRSLSAGYVQLSYISLTCVFYRLHHLSFTFVISNLSFLEQHMMRTRIS